jgi:hypothetical protein
MPTRPADSDSAATLVEEETADLPRFVWGRACAGLDQLDDRTFLTHTRAPRFVCAVSEVEEAELPDELREAGEDELVIVEVLESAESRHLWLTSSGLLFQAFSFADRQPDSPDLSRVLLNAAADFERFVNSTDPAEDGTPSVLAGDDGNQTRH